jgi:non-ribosomal peptide synthetase component F
MALLTGARLVVLTQNQTHDIAELNAVIKSQGIDVITLPPQYAIHAQLDTVKTLITAGSEAPSGITRKTDGRYINAYGPTENTVCATYWEPIKAGTHQETHPVKLPIGKPIPNVKT